MESRVKFDNVMKECIRQKYFFWKTHLKAKPETKEKYDSRELVYQVKSLFTSKRNIKIKRQ